MKLVRKSRRFVSVVLKLYLWLVLAITLLVKRFMALGTPLGEFSLGVGVVVDMRISIPAYIADSNGRWFILYISVYEMCP